MAVDEVDFVLTISFLSRGLGAHRHNVESG